MIEQIRRSVLKYCGPHMFGTTTSKDTIAVGFGKVLKSLETASKSTFHLNIKACEVISEFPTVDDYIIRLKKEIKGSLEYFAKHNGEHIIDTWAEISRRKPAFIPGVGYKPPTSKRFELVHLDKEEHAKWVAENSFDFLAEGYIVAYFNKYLMCPECGSQGCFGLAGGTSIYENTSFKDAVCNNCIKSGVNTVFEIKIRWEGVIRGKVTLYAGNYTTIRAFLNNNVNVYMVAVSRDTGTIRIGKVTEAVPKFNENFLYTVQEDLNWGAPASIVVCENIHTLSVNLPPIDTIFTDELKKQISSSAL